MYCDSRDVVPLTDQEIPEVLLPGWAVCSHSRAPPMTYITAAWHKDERVPEESNTVDQLSLG